MSDGPVAPLRPRVLLAVTGSVATVKVEPLVRLLLPFSEVRVIASARSLHFFDLPALRALVPVYLDDDEWRTFTRGDPVLHIELRKWADLLLIAPLSANTLAEIATGLCPNLVVSAFRPRTVCPAALRSPRGPAAHRRALHVCGFRRASLARGTSLSRCCSRLR